MWTVNGTDPDQTSWLHRRVTSSTFWLSQLIKVVNNWINSPDSQDAWRQLRQTSVLQPALILRISILGQTPDLTCEFDLKQSNKLTRWYTMLYIKTIVHYCADSKTKFSTKDRNLNIKETSSGNNKQNISQMHRFRSSCRCAKYHPCLCSPFIHSVVSNDSVDLELNCPVNTIKPCPAEPGYTLFKLKRF